MKYSGIVREKLFYNTQPEQSQNMFKVFFTLNEDI